jgi:hypothetical protein
MKGSVQIKKKKLGSTARPHFFDVELYYYPLLYDKNSVQREQMGGKKIIFNGQRRNKHFLIVIYHSSLVKGAMNAARLCKLRNGVKKMPQFLLFSMENGRPSVQ